MGFRASGWLQVKSLSQVRPPSGSSLPSRAVKKGDQVRVIDEKSKEKVIDLKKYGVMTRGSVGLKAVKF